MLLTGKNALVTGAASGIGKATAKRIAAEGARVLVVDVNEQGGKRVADEINGSGGAALFYRADISAVDEVNAMVAYLIKSWGDFDLAVNNAGFAEQPGLMHELDPVDWQRIINVDLTGTWLCMRAELAHFVARGGGAIVNTASGAGLKATPGLTAYSAAKHGVVGLTRTGAMDYVRQNIRINAVAPGLIRTPATENYPAEHLQAWADQTPTGRMGTPDEIAAGIVWLLSEQASYITGTVMEIDGGYMQA